MRRRLHLQEMSLHLQETRLQLLECDYTSGGETTHSRKETTPFRRLHLQERSTSARSREEPFLWTFARQKQ
jgi:hypothetical protein